MKLNHYLARAGIASRRKTVDLIRDGLITVNNQIVTDPAYVINEKDVVRFHEKKLTLPRYIYILLNKPKGFITSASDEQGRKTVFELLDPKRIRERIFAVGRLDKDTSGILLLTNDGELSQKLTHPSMNIQKVYIAEVAQPIDQQQLKKLKLGMRLSDGFIKPDQTAIIASSNNKKIKLTLHSGKYRIIRRMLAHVGLTAKSLERTKFAGLSIRGLKTGTWRPLNNEEIASLKSLVKKSKKAR